MSPLKEATSALSVKQSSFPRFVKALGDFFASRGTHAYVVGGAVRDALLGKEVSDVDLVVAGDTSGVASDLADHLDGHSFVLDESREIVRVVAPGVGGGATIDLSPLFGDIRRDLARRDFSLDAMAVSIAELNEKGSRTELIDPHDGESDLRAGEIRALSPSVFEADPARLMRAPRLSRQLGFKIAGETADWIRSHAPLVATVAPERVRDEFLKILAMSSVASSLRMLDDLGLLCMMIPELAEARGVAQPPEHHWDVFDHCIETAGQVEHLMRGTSENGPPDARELPRFEDMDAYFSEEAGDGHTRMTMLKLAGLLHDVAKPATRTVETSGRMRFLGHQEAGARVSERVLGRMRFSSKGTNLVAAMVEHHLRPSQMAQDGELPTSKAVYRYFRDVGDAAIDTLYLNMADYLAARGPQMSEGEWAERCRIIGHILQEGLAPKAVESASNLLDGHDLMRIFSLEPGPEIGVLLEMVREAQAGGEIASSDEAIQLVKETLSSGVKRA